MTKVNCLFTFYFQLFVYFFSGLVNWAFLLLCLGGIRLSLENFNKYGIRVNPKSWIDALFGQLDPFNENREYPTTFLILCKNEFCLLFAPKIQHCSFLIFARKFKYLKYSIFWRENSNS